MNGDCVVTVLAGTGVGGKGLGGQRSTVPTDKASSCPRAGPTPPFSLVLQVQVRVVLRQGLPEEGLSAPQEGVRGAGADAVKWLRAGLVLGPGKGGGHCITKPDMSTTPPRPRSALQLHGFVFSQVNYCKTTAGAGGDGLQLMLR